MSTCELCFVLLTSGTIKEADSVPVDFDAVYDELIAPAIEQAGLEPFRAVPNREGIIGRANLEGLMLCEYAIIDLSLVNAMVYYQLGIRDAIRNTSTVLIFPEQSRASLVSVPSEPFRYAVSAQGKPLNVDFTCQNLLRRLKSSEMTHTDGRLVQLIERFPAPPIARMKTDVFRDQVYYSPQVKERLARARSQEVGAAETLRSIEREFGDLEKTEAGVLVDLFLSYRAVKAWGEMIDLVGKLSAPLRTSVLIQEQLAFALNRIGEQERAIDVLETLLHVHGPNSETYGILGRVYKDKWEAAQTSEQTSMAKEWLDKAIEAYLLGFEADWRDAYPGINAVTLMEIREPPDPRRARLIPVVVYAAERRVASGKADYWDHATLLEAAVLDKRRDEAESAFTRARYLIREVWEPQTTARNLRLIREARQGRGERFLWADEIQQALEKRALHP